MKDPTADNTDLYAAPAWLPIQHTAGGPYFGKLDPQARY
jgi:hypothetical protein